MRKFLLSLPIFFLCACTGSSTASSGSVKTISGVVSAGPLNSATVTAYEMKADGTQGTQLGVTTSDAKGTYKLAMTSSSNPIMIVVSGGSYVEEASGSTISMGKAQFRTLLPAVTDGQKVGVTPITEIATQSALANISYNSSVSISAIIKNSNSKVATAMGLTDITLPPADPTLAAAQASSTAAAQYAVVLAAISQLAKTAATSNSTAVTSLDIMQALATSFTYNGDFGAQVGGVNVPVPNAAGASIALTAVFGGVASFSSAMQTATSTIEATLPTGFNNTAVVPTLSYTMSPAAPSGAPTLVSPSAPATLPSTEPSQGGPPKAPPPNSTPAPTPTPTPLTPVSGTWHTTTQVGGATADYATLAYSPTGSAFVGYSVINGSNTNNLARYDLYTAAQASNTTFATPVRVALGTDQTNRGGGIFGSFFFASASTIWLSAESDFFLNIYKSLDSGATWAQQTFYSISDRDQAFLHSLWFDLGSGNLAVYFGYEYYNPVVNSGPLLSYVNFTSGVWDTSLTQLSLTDDPTSMIKSGSNIVFPDNGGIANSSDNGANFSHNWYVGAKGIHKIGTTIYANDYSGLSKSTDSGITWSSVYSGNLSGNLAGNSTFLVVVSGENTNTLSYRASADGGITWTPPAVIVDYTSSGYYLSSVQVTASSNGRIGVAYSAQQVYGLSAGPGSIGKGVFFSEFY